MNKNQLINSIFYPRNSHISKDDNDHIVNMDDGEKVGVRFFLKSKKFPTIIFFHGNAELAQEYDDIGTYYNNFNLNFIVSDYRGYGLSTGSPNKENLHNDSKAVFSYVHNYLKNNKYINKIYIMGRSLGSASACEIIDNFKEDIDGCIIESGFATEHPLLSLLNLDSDQIDFSLEDGFMNLDKIRKYNGNLLIIHADLDDIIPFSQAELMLLESPSKNKDIYRVNGANHNNIILIAREDYFKKIKNFISSND